MAEHRISEPIAELRASDPLWDQRHHQPDWRTRIRNSERRNAEQATDEHSGTRQQRECLCGATILYHDESGHKHNRDGTNHTCTPRAIKHARALQEQPTAQPGFREAGQAQQAAREIAGRRQAQPVATADSEPANRIRTVVDVGITEP